MISVQYPHFSAHPFGIMSDHGVHPTIPALSRVSSHDHFSLSSGSKPKPASTSSAKKRPSRAGTRSVSTLTAAQLERKRSNDREAQRAIRQRTKDHIENLEMQIKELTSTNDANAKLMQTIQRNKELEQENAMLRSRLSSAVTTMSENGLNSDHLMLSAVPSSPTRRIKALNHIRSSTTPAPRSIPTPTVPSVSHQDQWGNAYSPASSTIERSPSAADVSPVTSHMRWSQQPPQVSPSIPEQERPMHPVDPNMQQPMGYGYVMDQSGRPVQPVQQVQYQQDPQMLSPYPQATSSPTHVNDYHNRHPSQAMSTGQASAYPSYSNPSGYMPPSPHEADPHMQMMHRQSVESQPQLLYNIPQNMKSE